MAENTPLRKLRKLCGLTGRQVAADLGIKENTYCRVEAAAKGHKASPDVALLIVQYFGGAVSLEQVLFPHRFPDYLSLKKFSPEGYRDVSESSLQPVSGRTTACS